MPPALNEEIRPDLVGTRELELREEKTSVGKPHLRRLAVAPADPLATPRGVHRPGGVDLASRGTGVGERLLIEPPRRGDEHAFAREIAPTWKRRRRGIESADAPEDGIAPVAVRVGEADAESLPPR